MWEKDKADSGGELSSKDGRKQLLLSVALEQVHTPPAVAPFKLSYQAPHLMVTGPLD